MNKKWGDAISLLGSTLAVGAVMIGIFAAGSVYAATPTLSLSGSGSNLVTMDVYGDPNSNVAFYYNVASASGMQTISLGTTNASGYFSTTINPASYNINAGQSVYVIVNGQQSSMQTWPLPTGNPTLSQQSVTIGLGQTTSVYSNGSSAPVYMVSNSNSAAVSVTTNGTQIGLVGNQLGASNISICYTGTASSCTNLYVVVQAGSVVTFSQNNITLAIGQGTSVVVSGGSGTYSVSGNSNPSIASESLNGNTISINPEETGTTNISVCDTANNCGTLSITVNGTTGGQVTFGMTNPTLTLGQTTSISLSGGGTYYVSSNPNSNVAQATINGTSIALYGQNVGTDSITVCASGGGCNTIYVTVNGQTTTVTSNNTSPSSLLAAIQSMQAQLAQLVTQIQSMATTLTQLAGTVSSSGTGTTSASTPTTSTSLYNFTQFLSVGSQGADVTALQQYLTNKDFYSGPITGFFGSATEAAVERYQTAHGIDPVGYVGPSTRSALNSGL